MSGDWKPGDVTRVAGMHALFVGSNNYSERWVFADGSQSHPDNVPAYSRLVVIDAEDAEQVERLAMLLWPHYAAHEHARLCKSEITADALREFASPAPRIEEPQGLGAVVQEGEEIWAHTDWATWRCLTTSDVQAREWRDFSASVRLLFEGVTE